MWPPVERAVVTAAGRGTRLWPATRGIQKELLNVLDRPALDYVLAEIAEAGVPEVLLVVGEQFNDVLHYLKYTDLPEVASGCKLQASTSAPVPPTGLGRSVLEARDVTLGKPFALLLGDNIITSRVPVLRRLIAVHRATGAPVLALTRIRPEQSLLYGCAIAGPASTDGVVAVHGLVEKPDPERAPSDLGIIGRYVLTPTIFGLLERLPRGRDNEYQLTDALHILARSEQVYGIVFDNVRYDIGSKTGLIEATIGLALERPDLREEIIALLRRKMT